MSTGTARDPKDASRLYMIDSFGGSAPSLARLPGIFVNQRRARWDRFASMGEFSKKGGASEMHRPFLSR